MRRTTLAHQALLVPAVCLHVGHEDKQHVELHLYGVHPKQGHSSSSVSQIEILLSYY